MDWLTNIDPLKWVGDLIAALTKGRAIGRNCPGNIPLPKEHMFKIAE